MNTRLVAVAVTAALPTLAFAAPETYTIDPVHSQPQWEATHIGFSKQHGNFGKATGKITLDRDAKKATIDVTIDAASIRTYDPRLDAVVKSEKFFDVEKYPTMTFKSTEVRFDGDQVVGASGELTMHGVTKPVMLTVTGFTCGANVFNKKPMCGAEATATIKRTEFGMSTGVTLGNPGDEIKLTIPVEAYLDQPQG